jgi:hypothetical protein
MRLLIRKPSEYFLFSLLLKKAHLLFKFRLALSEVEGLLRKPLKRNRFNIFQRTKLFLKLILPLSRVERLLRNPLIIFYFTNFQKKEISLNFIFFGDGGLNPNEVGKRLFHIQNSTRYSDIQKIILNL